MIKLKECEDSHLGEEVDRNWNEVVTQQYLFDRLAREVGVLQLWDTTTTLLLQKFQKQKWDLCS